MGPGACGASPDCSSAWLPEVVLIHRHFSENTRQYPRAALLSSEVRLTGLIRAVQGREFVFTDVYNTYALRLTAPPALLTTDFKLADASILQDQVHLISPDLLRIRCGYSRAITQPDVFLAQRMLAACHVAPIQPWTTRWQAL